MPEALIWRCNIDAMVSSNYKKKREQRKGGEEKARIRPEIPSWSWSSHDGPFTIFTRPKELYDIVSHPGSPSQTECNVLEARTTPKAYNPFGEVADAILVLHGLVLWDFRQVVERHSKQAPVRNLNFRRWRIPWKAKEVHLQPDQFGVLSISYHRPDYASYDIYLDQPCNELPDCIMMQVRPDAGLILDRGSRQNTGGVIHRRLGVCISDRLTSLRHQLQDGTWENRTVKIV